MKDYIDILKIILNSLSLDETNLGAWENFCDNLRQKFEQLRASGQMESFLDFLKQQYADDKEIYETLLRYIVNSVGDDAVKYILFDQVLNEELNGEDDIFTIWELKMQLRGIQISGKMHIDRKKDYELYQHMNKNMLETLGRTYTKIPVEKRDRDCVVFVSTVLIGTGNAPTKLMLEFARIMTELLGKKVIIINVIKKMDVKTLEKIRVKDYRVPVYIEDLNGAFRYPYKGKQYLGYQFFLDKDKMDETREVLDYVYQLRPLCVWEFGGIPTFANMIQQFTTMIYMGFNQGYMAVPTDILVNYFKNSPLENKKEKEYVCSLGINVKDIEISLPISKAEGKIQRGDFDLPENAFTIAVVGNRLEGECDKNFLETLRQAMAINEKIYVVYIGMVSEKYKKYTNQQLVYAERVRYIGHQEELIEVLHIMDLFANPKRPGGAGAAHWAMKEGKPVITFGNCDVSSFCGREFVCKDQEEYLATVVRYASDSAFYQEQSKKAVARVDSMETSDPEMAEQIYSVLAMTES